MQFSYIYIYIYIYICMYVQMRSPKMTWCELKHAHVILFLLNKFTFEHTFPFLQQSRHTCMQFRSYATFSLLNTNLFYIAETRWGITATPWTTDTSLHSQLGALHPKGSINTKHKKVSTALSPPSPRTTFLHYLDTMVLLSREIRWSGLQSPYHVPGTLSFRFHRDVWSKSQGVFSHLMYWQAHALTAFYRMRSQYPNCSTTLTQRALTTGLNWFHNEAECFQDSGTVRK
jgi:hypothetical protein